MVFNQNSFHNLPLHVYQKQHQQWDDQSPQTVFRLVSSSEEREKLFQFTSHTALWRWFQSWFPMCLCKKKRVEIKNETNKDQTKSTCPKGAHTRRTMAAQQMNPPKCKIFHDIVAALKCYTFWCSSVNHLRGLSQLSRRDGLLFLRSHHWQGTQLSIEVIGRKDSQQTAAQRKKQRKTQRRRQGEWTICTLFTSKWKFTEGIFLHISFPLSQFQDKSWNYNHIND